MIVLPFHRTEKLITAAESLASQLNSLSPIFVHHRVRFGPFFICLSARVALILHATTFYLQSTVFRSDAAFFVFSDIKMITIRPGSRLFPL